MDHSTTDLTPNPAVAGWRALGRLGSLDVSENLNLKRVLTQAVLVPLLLSLAFAGLLFLQVRYLQNLGDWVERSELAITETRDAQRFLVEIETNARGFLISGAPVYFERFEAAKNEFPERMKRLESAFTGQVDQLARVSALRESAIHWQKDLQLLVSARSQGKNFQAAFLDPALQQRVLRIRHLGDEIVRAEEELKHQRRAAATSRVRWGLGIGAALALLVGTLITIVTRRQIIDVSNAYKQALREQTKAQALLKKSHEELECKVVERTIELSASNSELEAFCYSVSHDLRAPLRGIDGFSKALIEDYGNAIDDTGQKYLKYIREGVQRMGILIDDLLELSRLSRVEMRKQFLDLGELADSIAARLASESPERAVKFISRRGMTITADRGLMAVALENLISNAWKFTEKTAAPRIEFGEMDQKGQRVFFIRDNGAGFDMAYVNKLFGAFQRLHSPREFRGTGIGLATVRRVINRHGGQIWAEGEVGKGATFYFTLDNVGFEMAEQRMKSEVQHG